MLVVPGRDQAIDLFVACLTAGAPMWFERQRPPESNGHPLAPVNILEVGYCESNWLDLAHAAWPHLQLTGLDWRAPADPAISGEGMVTRLKGNGLDPDVFTSESFDGIVSLSAIEHVGLGHYDHDPRDPDGDIHMIANCWRWLKPGGWLYFDVPFSPEGYYVAGTEYRCYDGLALYGRLFWAPGPHKWLHRPWVSYVHVSDVSTLIPRPTANACERFQHYAACCWVKGEEA